MAITITSLLLFFVLVGFLYILPILLILLSKKTVASEKLGWILAIWFISWFAWIFYLIFAPIQDRQV
ncbi:hypothetical protein [Kangiella sp. TOML190]|uniref:hypothetical protein n=1 Tax=Kangiella sp. TOML190 TaxID=2931351 RepID=UPI00203AC315|nr:hypothetical protein [Kangiella sp. TOML190]